MAERYMVPEVKVSPSMLKWQLTITSITVALERDNDNRMIRGITLPVNKVLEERMGVFSLVFHTKYGTARGRFRLTPHNGNIRTDWNCSDDRLHIDSFVSEVASNIRDLTSSSRRL